MVQKPKSANLDRVTLCAFDSIGRICSLSQSNVTLSSRFLQSLAQMPRLGGG
jgi:hypothetical protein